MKRLSMFILILTFVGGGSWVHATQMPEELVGVGTDDGHEEWVWNHCYLTEDWICMSHPHDCEWGFYRFTSIPIPQGATIDACTLFVDILSTTYDSPYVSIFCEDTASATTLVAEDNCITSRTQTTASVEWHADNIGAGYKPTPELKTIFQEVIDRNDWNENHNVAFIFVAGSDKSFYTDSYEIGQPAKLHVWYTAEEAEADKRVMWRK